MAIRIECESCGEKRKVNERLAGRTIRCPGCEQPLTIPKPETAEPVAAEIFEAEPAKAEPANTHVVEAEAVSDSTGISEDVGNAAIATAAIATEQTSTNGDSIAANGAEAFDPHGTAPTMTAETAAVANQPAAGGPAPNPLDDDDDEGLPPRKKREDGELDMTPMVDVTFLLLIFFMVTASFSLQKSIQMPRQSSDLPSMSNVEEETEELDPIELEIDENGAFLVLTNDGETETPGKQNLIKALKVAIGNNRDGMRLDIKVHENAKLQALVDGMDSGTIAGFTEIQVTEVDGFD